jgi:autotransporter adhesin
MSRRDRRRQSTAAINGGQLNVGLASVAATIGGGSTYNPTTGQVTAPAYTVQGGTFTNVGAALGALNTGVNANTTVIAGNTTAITALGNLLANGGAGPVQYANAATPTTPNGGTKSQDLTLVGAAPGAVGLHNVAVGAVNAASTDAIDGSQLYATNQGVAGNTAALGGGAGFNPQTGAYTPPSYAVQGQTYSNVGAAVNALNGGVTAANGAAAAAGTTATTALALARNSVQYDASGPTNVTFNPGGAAASLHNVSAGLAANDAVNVGQLAAAQLQTLGQANAYTNAGLARIDFDLRAVDRRAQSSAAATSALSGIPQVITPGMGLVGGAIGGQGDYVAIAIGASKAFNDGHTIAKAAISYIGTTNQVGYHVGVGYQF